MLEPCAGKLACTVLMGASRRNAAGLPDRKSRQGSDEVLKWVKRSTITIAISGMLVAIWQGIKQLLNGG